MSLQSFFHTHDRFDLFHLYAPTGFVEYQFVVPFEQADVIRLVIERIAGADVEPFFAVVKRFGQRTPAALSFPRAGLDGRVRLRVHPRSAAARARA